MLVPFVLTLAAALPPAQAETPPLPAEASFAGEGDGTPQSCFTMEPPSKGWRRLELNELREVYPEAEVGLAGPQGVNSVLCVRRDPRLDLAACVDELLAEQLLEQSRATFREPTRVEGRPAAHALVSGRRDGTWWRYHATAFREGDDLYLVLSWGRSDEVPADGSTFLDATLGLQRLEGVGFDDLSRAGSASDAEGPGWRVRGGVYRDAALGFALVPRGAWRVATRAELADLGEHVHAGLVDELHGAVLGFVAERVPGVNPGDYAEDCRRRAVERGHAAGTVRERILGREVEVRRYALPSPTGFADGTVRGVFAVLFEGDRCFQVLGRYPSAAEQAMGRSLPQGLASLRLLDEAERANLATQLARDPARVESVGPGWSLRGGVYTDYPRGLRWRLPPGYWEVGAGSGGDGATLEMYERDLGVRGWIRVDDGPRFAGEEGHKRALEALTGNRLRLAPEQALEVRFGPLVGLASSCDVRTGSTSMRALLASAGDERHSLRLCLMGPIETMERHAVQVAAALESLEVSATPLTPTVMDDGRYRDVRMGFELDAPHAEWRFSERKIERFGPRAAAAEGVLVAFEDGAGQGVYTAAAWSEAGPGDPAEQPWATWIPTALQSAVRLPSGEPVRDEAGRLNGLPCRFLTWTDGPRTIELALARRSRTAFVAAAVSTDAQAAPRAWLDGFRLAE